MMKNGKAAGPTGIVLEMFMADKDSSVEWLTPVDKVVVYHTFCKTAFMTAI